MEISMKKRILLIIITGLILAGLTGCDKLDVIGDRSVTSFNAVLGAQSNLITEDSNFGGWSLEAPDKTTRLLWSKDFSKTAVDVLLETDAQPFLDAGLNIDLMPEGMVNGDKIIAGADYGSDIPKESDKITPLISYRQIVQNYRDRLKYHATLDHFGLDLSNGNMFEWAKKMETNDKDIVFVLNPQPFIDAGTDVNKIEGWIFAKVTTMDAHGKKIQVDKLLKPFDLLSENK
jgi:hypothetical protein